MTPLHSFTRGGQLVAHQFRMLKHISTITIITASLSALMIAGVLFSRETAPYQRYLYTRFLMTEFNVRVSFGNAQKIVTEVRDEHGRIYKVRAVSFLKNPEIRRQVEAFEETFKRACKKSLGYALLTGFLVISFFVLRGYRTSRKHLERGGRMIEPRVLRRLIIGKKQASDLTLDGLPLLKHKETSHILITGTTGSGKTNCFHTLLPKIRKRGNRAIVVDLTGDFVSKYYRQGHDILLNPLDARSLCWNPWGECLMDAHHDTLAAAIVPKSTSFDIFWENASKALLSAALKKLADTQDIQKLYHILVKDDLSVFSKFFRDTEAATYTHEEGEKMTLSIRATLANHLQSFRYLRNAEHTFSIRKWVAGGDASDQWLFLTASPDQRSSFTERVVGYRH